jgi:hypothetical protein
MPEYRAYIIGIDGRRFIKATQFLSDHADDAAAMKAAEQLVDKHDVELWDCARLVARIDPAKLRVLASPVEKATDPKSEVEGSTAPGPSHPTPDVRFRRVGAGYARDNTRWRAGRRTAVAIAKLFRRNVG